MTLLLCSAFQLSILSEVRLLNFLRQYVFRLRMEMETREGKHNEKNKENEKDVKKTYNNQKMMCYVLFGFKMAERNISHV